MQPTGFREQFTAIADAWALAQGIVDTVREPVLVLDNELRVIAASRSFYSAFKVKPIDTQGRPLYALGDGQWDIPKLRVLLEKIIPEKGVMEGYEVEHEFPGLGHRTMRLNARQVFYEGGANITILLGIEDVTANASWSAKRTGCCCSSRNRVHSPRRSWIRFASPSWCSTRSSASSPRAVHSIRHSRSVPRTPKAGFFTRWAMVNGTFQGFGCSWKKSCLSEA